MNSNSGKTNSSGRRRELSPQVALRIELAFLVEDPCGIEALDLADAVIDLLRNYAPNNEARELASVLRALTRLRRTR